MALVYENPVWDGYFADPFVLRIGDRYYAYGTGAGLEKGPRGTKRAFAVLRSRDLVRWKFLGGALVPPEGTEGNAFWAPEVAMQDGRFFLYYSTAPRARDELHRLRVAVASEPTGPFTDAGPVLSDAEGFSIDAHPFRDPRDGQWHLFFAKDFLEGRTGTGLAVVPLTQDMLRAAAPATTVLRANADWQIYERDRTLYGRTWEAWHTVEGPCVIVHEGRYYCLYSGGNWQTRDYGVSYAVADHPLGPWTHAAEPGPVVLRERPPHVLGPGHNCHAIARDGTELIVYHAWDRERTARRMCIDPLDWTERGPRCRGPSLGPQRIG